MKYGDGEYRLLLNRIVGMGQQQRQSYNKQTRIQQELARQAHANQELERRPLAPHTDCQLPECSKWRAREKNYCPEHQSNLESWLNRKGA